MERLVLNYKDWDKYYPIIRAALLYGELVKIHPFIEENGGTSRLVMNLSLMKSGFLPVIIKKDKRLDYYNALVVFAGAKIVSGVTTKLLSL